MLSRPTMLFGAQLQDSPEDVHGSCEWNGDLSPTDGLQNANVPRSLIAIRDVHDHFDRASVPVTVSGMPRVPAWLAYACEQYRSFKCSRARASKTCFTASVSGCGDRPKSQPPQSQLRPTSYHHLYQVRRLLKSCHSCQFAARFQRCDAQPAKAMPWRVAAAVTSWRRTATGGSPSQRHREAQAGSSLLACSVFHSLR